MAALVREAGLSVVRELMSKGRTKGSSSGSLAGVQVTHPGDDGSAPSSSRSDDISGSSVADAESDSRAAESEASEAVCISARHFESALGRVRPSVALHDRQRYKARTLTILCFIYISPLLVCHPYMLIIALNLLPVLGMSGFKRISRRGWAPSRHCPPLPRSRIIDEI
jgi:hypothetical protein